MKAHGPLRVKMLTEPMFQENGLVLWHADADEAWVIDPGFPPQPASMVQALTENKLRLQAIVLTHCHVDHIAGVRPLIERTGPTPLWAPRDEQHMLDDPFTNLSAAMGMEITAPQADRLLMPGEQLTLGPLTWRVLDVAGHSPGGLAYYCAEAGVVIGGDALFYGSIGRYDFPGSDRERLLENIQSHLLTLPDETVLYSGHGPATTIGHERKYNLTLRAEMAE